MRDYSCSPASATSPKPSTCAHGDDAVACCGLTADATLVALGGAAAGEFCPAAEAGATESLPPLSISDAQFGAKIGKHASDYGLNPADPAARMYLRNLIDDVRNNPDEVRVGPWHPTSGGGNGYLFFRQGSDVVVAKPDGSFVTILRGGQSSGWFKGATPR
jgi:hypothetical protein